MIRARLLFAIAIVLSVAPVLLAVVHCTPDARSAADSAGVAACVASRLAKVADAAPPVVEQEVALAFVQCTAVELGDAGDDAPR